MRGRSVIIASVLMWSLMLAAPPPSHARAPKPAPLIVIDPGHGGRYSNANANGLKEKNVNLAVAYELRRALVSRGYRVQMTRYSDRVVRYSDTRTWTWRSMRWRYAYDGRRGLVGGIPRDDLQARADKANDAGASLFISIHSNGARNRRARGTETWASSRDYLGRRLAPIVQRAVVRETGLRNRGARTADFYVCRWTNMPSILVETAFITNRRDASLLKKARFRRRLATGIAKGVDSWMNTSPYRRIYPRMTASTTDLATAVSRRHFGPGTQTLVVAPLSGAGDLPGIAGLATRLGGPVLWTGRSGPTSETASELARLAPTKVVFAGVDGSYDATTLANIALASGVETSSVEVITGPDRSSVSASIAESMGVGANREVLVVKESDRHSKSLAAAIGAAKGMPILLTGETTVSASVSAWLTANSGNILRGIVVGSASRTHAPYLQGLPSAYMIDGPSYAYNASVLNARYYGTARFGATRPIVATMGSSAQYLAASVHAAKVRQPVLPVWDSRLPAYSREWITNRRSAIGGFEIIANGSVPTFMDRMLAKSDYL